MKRKNNRSDPASQEATVDAEEPKKAPEREQKKRGRPKKKSFEVDASEKEEKS